MAVRFLPPPEDRAAEPQPDRADLAEVIELRSLMSRRGWAGDSPEDPGERPRRDGLPRQGDSADAQHEAADAQYDSSDAQHEAAEVQDGAADERSAAVEARSVSEDGVRLLARRARSSGELRAELLALGHDASGVDGVIDEFERSLYLDDQGLARAVAEKLREAKRASRAQIRVKLRERRLPDEAIEAALAEFDDEEEFELLRSTAQQRAAKLGGLDRQTAERRLLGFLARRGWSGERAARAAREALDGAARPSGGVRFR